MARLRARLRGKVTQDLALDPNRSYLAGRKEDCDIVLVNEKSISREHFKVFYSEGQWQIEVLSKYCDVLIEGEAIQQSPLKNHQLFFLGPYEFEFSEEMPSSEGVSADAAEAPAPSIEAPAFPPVVAEGSVVDRTFIASSENVPYIKVVSESGDMKELFKLEGGDSWIAGRDASCDIVIRDQRVSRRQFEVRRRGGQFLIMDLGSVNGTLLNGNPVSSTDFVAIKSGDAIGVLSNHLYFELHDPAFKARMELVNANMPSPLVAISQDLVPASAVYPPAVAAAAAGNYGYPPTPHRMGYPPPPPEKKFDYEKHRLKLIAGAAVFLAVAYLFSGQGTDSRPPASAPVSAKPNEAFNKLTPEQQILLKQTYLLAKNLYMQGKYELAKAEVAKIYELVPDYEDTKDIERLANEALIIQDQKRREEERQRNDALNEEKIQTQVAACRGKITPDTTLEQLEECISPVMQFNPTHPAFAELRRQVEENVMQKQMRETQKAEHQARARRLKALYSRAESRQKEGQYLDALKEYKAVVGSNLPDPENLKTQARRQITAIQQTLKQKTDQFINEAGQAYKDQKLKEAILALRKCVEVDPSNEDAKDKITKYTLELKKQMMTLYQEGILEESFGNVEGSESKPGAKDKWKKIMDLDIPEGEYYGKAKIKLKKYGAM